MKHTIIREQPVQPLVKTITLEVTPAELLTLARAVGYNLNWEPLWAERSDNPEQASVMFVFDALKRTMIDASLTK